MDRYVELVSLREWLTAEGAPGGRIALEHPQSKPDQMGSVADAVTVPIGAGGATTVPANTLSVWLSHRTSDVKIEMANKTDYSATVSAERVPDAAVEQVLQIAENGSRREP